ncbi:MAG: hypothetical protein GXO14_03375 [Thermococci archaeon]|nr:hypothetical protein [Thermococci archaeon]
MESRLKFIVITLCAAIVIWFFLPKVAGLMVLLLGMSLAGSGTDSKYSTVVSGSGVLMIFAGVAMMMTDGRAEVMLMGLSLFAVFMLRAVFWEVEWIKHRLMYLLALSFSLALLPVSEKFSALSSSLIMVFILGSVIEDTDVENYGDIFKHGVSLAADSGGAADDSGLMDFIEKGDKTKLIAYIAYHSPGVVPREKFERVIGMILEYRDSRLLRWTNRKRRKRLVGEVLRMLGEEASGWVR